MGERGLAQASRIASMRPLWTVILPQIGRRIVSFTSITVPQCVLCAKYCKELAGAYYHQKADICVELNILLHMDSVVAKMGPSPARPSISS